MVYWLTKGETPSTTAVSYDYPVDSPVKKVETPSPTLVSLKKCPPQNEHWSLAWLPSNLVVTAPLPSLLPDMKVVSYTCDRNMILHLML